MEIRENLIEKYFAVKIKDPYKLAHDLIHASYKYGRVIEKENAVLASGPRTNSIVKFTIKKEIDKFTILFADVSAEGDSLLEELSVAVMINVSSELPEARGLMTGIFHQNYLDRTYAKMKQHAAEIATQIIDDYQRILENQLL